MRPCRHQARDRDMVGMSLGNTCGNRAHTDFGDQLDRDLTVGLAFFRS